MYFNILLGLYLLILLNVDVNGQYDCFSRSSIYESKYILPMLSSLSKEGYNIIKGNLFWYTNMKEHGGSPSSAYGMYNFSLPINLKPNMHTGSSAWLFGPSDAIIFTGCTSPPASYIGIENYAYAKYIPRKHINNTNKSNGAIKKLKENKESIVFGSLNGAINTYYLNISNEDRESNYESPFNSLYTVITTGDKITYNNIYNKYLYYNITDTINNIWIPQQYFKFTPYNFSNIKYNYTVFNYPKHIDSFMAITRIINHFDNNRFNKYVNYSQNVYLITAQNIINNSNKSNPRVPYNELFDRNQTKKGQISEFNLYQNYINIFINDTLNYFKNKHNISLIEKNPLNNYNQGLHNYGWSCYNNNWNCQGDLRDEQYWGTHNGSNVVRRHWPWNMKGTYYLQDNSMYLLIGINHQSTNFTIFDNIIFYYDVNQYLGLFEPIFMFINNQYNNSANIFNNNIGNITSIPKNILSKFYIIQVGRPDTCKKYSNEFLNIPTMCPNRTIVKSGHKFALYTRNLLNPSTLTRPSPTQIIPDTFIHLKIPSQ